MTNIPERWAERARYDLEAAKSMLETGRLLYVLFCCQQAAEKMLKALISKNSKQLPPRIHNLMRLAEMASLKVTGEKADFFRELSSYYIQSRYPDEISDDIEDIGPEVAKEMLIRQRRLFNGWPRCCD